MPQTIEVPGYGDVEFPDGMTDDQISAAIQQNMKPQLAPMRRFGSGKSYDVNAEGGLTPTAEMVNTPSRGMTDLGEWLHAGRRVGEAGLKFTTGVPAYIAGNFAGLGALGYDMAANAVMHPFSGSTPGAYANPTAVREAVTSSLTYQPSEPDSISAQMVDVPGRIIQGSGEWLGKQADKTNLPYVGTIASSLPEAGANALGLSYSNAPKVPKLEPKPVPTTAELKAASSKLYKAADDAGVVIRPESTQRVVEMMQKVADTENLGKLTPKIKEASDVLAERASSGKPLSLMDADKVRQLINDAKKSTDAGDRRLATIIQRQYDDYLNNLKPEDTLAGNTADGVALLKQARDTYRRTSNSAMLDAMQAKAARVGETNYTQAGQELALRREFLRLANNDKRMRVLTQKEQAAITKVASPGVAANVLRNIGKFDPGRGGMGAALGYGVGGGLGATIGGIVGGAPGAGAGSLAGSALIGGAANLANRLALRGTKGRVASAREALVGRGIPTVRARSGIPSEVAQAMLERAKIRPAADIRAEMGKLIQQAGRTTSQESTAAIWKELERLQAELATAESRGSTQGGSGGPQNR